MATASDELFEAGRLDEAVKAQTDEVRAKPSDPERRYVLFALLCFQGDLKRANAQLDALGVGVDAGKIEMRTLLLRGLLAAENERRGVWDGSAKPLLAPDAPPVVAKRLAILERIRLRDDAGAERALEEAVEATGIPTGRLNGAPFDALRDTDDVLGTVLEVYAAGRCLWLDLSQVRRLEIPKPESILDLLWTPAKLLDARGNDANVHVPALYAGSHATSDDALRLGRRTEWIDAPGGLQRGVGQKVLLTVQGEADADHGLLDVRALEVDAA
jgi:type VI secretion system protein ImpE